MGYARNEEGFVKAGTLATLVMTGLMIAGAQTASAAVLRVNRSGYWGSEPVATTVQAAIDAAAAGDEIWVAEGTYLENCALKDGVSLFGGFGGTEASRAERKSTTGGRSSRDWLSPSVRKAGSRLGCFGFRKPEAGFCVIRCVSQSQR